MVKIRRGLARARRQHRGPDPLRRHVRRECARDGDHAPV